MSNLVVIHLYICLLPETACGALTLPHTQGLLNNCKYITYISYILLKCLGDGLGWGIQRETIYTTLHVCFDPSSRLLLINAYAHFPFPNYCLLLLIQPSLPLLLRTTGTFFNLLQVYLVFTELIRTINLVLTS